MIQIKNRQLYVLMIFFFSVTVCTAQTVTEKKESSSATKKNSLPRIIFDDSNAQLLSIDTSGSVVENRIVAFQLYVTIKGISYSEQALGSRLNKAMLDLIDRTEPNTILYFENIQVKNASGNLVEADDFQYNLGYKKTPQK